MRLVFPSGRVGIYELDYKYDVRIWGAIKVSKVAVDQDFIWRPLPDCISHTAVKLTELPGDANTDQLTKKQAPKPRSYASPKLRPTQRLTGVKCRATSVAKKWKEP